MTKKPDGWGQVRKNVVYLGCYPDLARSYAQYEDESNYFTGDPKDFRPAPVADARLPKARDYTQHFADGPARIIPSIEPILRPDEDPRTLPLDQALKRCYDMARSKNKRYFALQSGGLCFATNSKQFMEFGAGPPGLCHTCKDLCITPYVPCGKDCIKPGGKCDKKLHKCCSSADAKQRMKSTKAGGYFANSTFVIKDIHFDAEAGEDVGDVATADEVAPNAYAEFTYPPLQLQDRMVCETKNPLFPFDLTPAQRFLARILTPNSPHKGILRFAGAGSGKTCEGLNVMGNFMETNGWRICWVTRRSLDFIPKKELFKNICIEKLRTTLEKPDEPIVTGGKSFNTPAEKIAWFKKDGRKKWKAAQRLGVKFEEGFILSYAEFVGFLTGKTAKGKELQQSQKARDVIHHQDLGYKTLFVMDEAHNWISSSLSLEEREALDEEYPPGITLFGRTYNTTRDIYGDIGGIDRPIQGRDLFAAMLYRSYEQSGADSAKSLLLTATPMSTSPTEMFYLTNLLLTQRKLSLNLDDYYDKSTLRLKDEAVTQFAAACHGRMAFFDASLDSTQFALKVLQPIQISPLHRFHQRLIDAKVEEFQKDPQAHFSHAVKLFNNLSLCAKTEGPFFAPSVIEEYEADVKRWHNWDSEREKQYQENLYDKEIGLAQEAFGFKLKPTDEKLYQKKLKLYDQWFADHKQTIENNDPLSLLKRRKAVGPDETLVSLEEWLQGHDELPTKIQTEYARLMQVYSDFQNKLTKFTNKEIKSKPRRPKELAILMKTNGDPKTIEEYGKEAWSHEFLQPRDVQQYEMLKEKYWAYKSELGVFNALSKQSRGRREQLPARPDEIEDVVDDLGQLRPLSDWFILYKGFKPTKTQKKYNEKQTKFLKYLIRDPTSGVMRLRTKPEFVQVVSAPPSLDGIPTGNGKRESFIMTSTSFNGPRFRQLMPYYAPRIFACIENIIRLEKESRARFGHGFKHTVFTFSKAGHGTPSYGSKVVASAFHAFSDVFKVLLVYDDLKVVDEDSENGEQKTILKLRTDAPKGDQWGVCVYSSSNIDNIYHEKFGGQQSVSKSKYIKAANEEAFNDPANTFGDHIKVCILDGAFAEGVSLKDTGISHFLTPGLSKSELEQASARGVRGNCSSKHLPFYEGVGAFNEMYFYDNEMPDGRESLNEQMLKHIPFDEQVKLNMMDVFSELAKNFSVDYWLNYQVNHFHPAHQGTITGYYDDAYLVTMDLVSGKYRSDYEFIVDIDNVTTKFHKGQACTDHTSGKMGKVLWIDPLTQLLHVNFEDGISVDLPARDLRLLEGTAVEFQIPSGVSLAQKMLNIGNYEQMHPSDIVSDMVADIRIPANAVNVLRSSFRNNLHFTLIGFVSMLRMVQKSGVSTSEVHFVLPKETVGVPSLADIAIQWVCDPGTATRKLLFDPDQVRSFLSPTQGLSVMLLYLNGARCGSEVGASSVHTNLLIFTPAWGTIERFDCLGYSGHDYESVALDSQLHDLIEQINPEFRYMSSVETCPLIGLQRKLKPGAMDASFSCSVFSLFYLQMRILYASESLKKYPKEKREIFPLQFQRGLIHAVDQGAAKGFNLETYIISYAEVLVQSREFIMGWEGFVEDEPFWKNTTRLLLTMESSNDMPRVSLVKHAIPQGNILQTWVDPHKKKPKKRDKMAHERQESVWNSLQNLVRFLPFSS